MIIGIIGAKQSGKSTLGKYLTAHFGYKRIAMASPLKGMLRAMGLNEEQLNGDLKEVPDHVNLCGQTPRHAMQTLGTEWGRHEIGDDIWLNLWRNEANKHSLVVCDDVRFPNEMDLIRSMGGLIVKVRRPGMEGASAHASELHASTMKFDFEIVNDEEVDEFHDKILHCLMPELDKVKSKGKEKPNDNNENQTTTQEANT